MPDAPAEAVAAVRPRGRLDRDVGLAQDRDIPARGAVGHPELRGELGSGDAGLGLQ